MTGTSAQRGTGIAGAQDAALRTTGVCTTCGKEIEAPWAVRTGNGRLLRFCGPACAYPDPRNVLAAKASAWLREVERAGPLPDDRHVLGGITVGDIRAAEVKP